MNPWIAAGLWAVVLGAIGLWGVGAGHRRRRRLEEYLEGERRAEFWPRGGWRIEARVRQEVRALLLAVSALALGGALAGVPWGKARMVVDRAAAPLVVVMDVSWSMAVADVAGGRMNRARILALRAAARKQRGEVGVVVFAGEAWVLLPLTTDEGLVRAALESLAPGLIARPGSFAGQGLKEARRLLEEAGSPPGSSVLLLSDGEWHQGGEGAVEEARALARQGVAVWGLTLGTPEGGAVLLEGIAGPRGPHGGGWRLQTGRAETESSTAAPWSRAAPEEVARVAREGGGAAGRADREDEVQRVLEGLAEEWGREDGLDMVEVPQSGRPVFLSVALLTLLVEWVLGTPRWRVDS